MSTAFTVAATSLYYQDVNVENWQEILQVFKVFEIVALGLMVWTFLCVVIYGKKSKRWKRSAGGSQLNNGPVFIIVAVTVSASIAKFAVTLAIYELPHTENGLEECELMGDVGDLLDSSCIYLTYFFIWFRMGLVYSDPFVKPVVPKWVNWLRRLLLLYITLALWGYTIPYIVKKSREGALYGCVLQQQNIFPENSAAKYTSIPLLLFAKIAILSLALYPAVRVNFRTTTDQGECTENSTEKEQKESHCWRTLCQIVKGTSFSPIHLAVRRTAAAAMLIVICDIFIVAIEGSRDVFPDAFLCTIYDISTLIKVISMLGTFSFFSKVFTFYCPSWSTKGKRRSQQPSTIVDNDTQQSTHENVV